MTKTKVLTRYWWLLPIVVALSAFLAIGIPALTTRGADHLDAPFIKMDGRIDINDLYVFHPDDGGDQDHGRTVLAMTVNPAAGAISGTRFKLAGRYEFMIDRDGDARTDARIRATFKKAPKKPGRQLVTVNWIEGGNSTPLVKNRLTDKVHAGSNDSWVFAGLVDDPFFMDLGNFNNGATFCGTGLAVSNFFAGLNASAIVVEIPTDLIGDGPVGVWARTTIPDFGQADRIGRPGINTVFIPQNPFEPDEESLKDAFNFTRPRGDQRLWRGEIVDSLTVLFSLNDATDDAAQIEGLADILLPDILTVDLSLDTGYLNGRNLADDVIDASLGLITEGLLTTDCVDSDSAFRSDFPYLAEPN